ncbi:VacJ [Neisseriaceae bacterium ESL0693]|nr:VacJ [Neisseriaceae bacterium ESL0693]
MYEVNRSVILLIPLEPFWLWLQNLPGLPAAVSLADLQQNANAYLVPAADSIDEIRNYIEAQYQSVFAAELADWCEDQTLWPSIDPATFFEWFTIRTGAVVTDLAQEDLMREAFAALQLN